MKNTLYSLIITVLLLVGCAPLVHANEKEAGEAAKLANTIATASAQPQITDIRVQKLEAYLKHYRSPMWEEAHIFVEEADRLDLDWRLVVSIAGVESTFGRFIPTGSYNPFGWGVFTGKSYGIAFKDWEDAITTVSEGLRTKYVNRGAATVEQIGYIYAASPAWSGHVRYFINDLERFSPTEPLTNKAIAMTL